MADRSFEEQVRKELEALRLKPDDTVWQNVEAELHKDKKRRWLIWLFALLFTAGSAGLYYQFNDAPDRNRADSKVTNPAQPLIESGPQSPVKEMSKPAPVETEHNTDNVAATAGKKANTVNEPPPVAPVGEKTAAQRIETAENSMISARKKTAITRRSGSSVKDQNQSDKTMVTPELPVKTTAESGTIKNETAPTTLKPETAGDRNSNLLQTTETALAKNEQQKTEDPLPVGEKLQRADSVQPAPAATTTVEIKKTKQPWQFFVSVETGRSGEITSLRSAGRVLDFASQNFGGGAFFAPGNNLANSSATLFRTPSRNDGGSFGLMVQALKPFGKKSNIGVSAGYAYYSSIVGVGTRVQAASALVKTDAPYYYLSTDSTNYTNRYHYLSVNVDYYLNLRLGKATSLRWRLGVGTGLLLATNALHFSDQNGILYKNNSLIPTIQWNMSTGLDLGLGKKQGFFMGPQLSYFLNRTSGESSTGRHLFIAGLRASVAIPKKKK